jgi:hypothetical protein
MPTKLANILFCNRIKQKDLFDEINKRFEPPVQLYQISKLYTGTSLNLSIKTYQKILTSVNRLSNKNLTLNDIVEDNICNEDLK